MSKKVFIIIITYNNRTIISHCLESLNQQTHDNFELLVVDNDSTDDTLTVVENYLKKK